MSLKFKLGFLAIVAAQVVLLLGMVGFKEFTLRTGTTVVLQTVPVDPRSLLQGDYVVLRYEISRLPDRYRSFDRGQDVDVLLSEGKDVWQATYYARSAPREGTVFIKGTVDDRGSLDFGIGTYFVPEGTGRPIERSRDVKVKVSVDRFGHAVIKELLVDGEPFKPTRE